MDEFFKLYLTGKNQTLYRVLKFLAAFFNTSALFLFVAEGIYAFYLFQEGTALLALGIGSAASSAAFFAVALFINLYSGRLTGLQMQTPEGKEHIALANCYMQIRASSPSLFVLPMIINGLKFAAISAFALLPAAGVPSIKNALPLWILGGGMVEIYADFFHSFVTARTAGKLLALGYADLTTLYIQKISYMTAGFDYSNEKSLFFKNDADRRAFKKLSNESLLWGFSSIFLTVCALILLLRPINDGLPPIYAFFTFVMMVVWGMSVYFLSSVRYGIYKNGILRLNLQILQDTTPDNLRKEMQIMYLGGRKKRNAAFLALIAMGLALGLLTGILWRVPGATVSVWNNMAALMFLFFVAFGIAALIVWSSMFAAYIKKIRPLEEKLLIIDGGEDGYGK